MKIWYVTMQFPAPSETFAGVEVRALLKCGVDVEVYTLRTSKGKAKALLDEWGIEKLPLRHCSWRTFFNGLVAIIGNLLKFIDITLWVFRKTALKPMELLKCLVLLPRVFELFGGVVRTRPDVVHLFWGHYPSLLGYLVNRYCPETKLSIFLGAYDLRQGFACSADVAREADLVWTHTQYNVDVIETFGVPLDKIRLNYRGIDLNSIPPLCESRVKGRIVTAGRLLPFKGMDTVLRVFHAIHLDYAEASLDILGDGPEREHLVALAKQLGIHEAVRFKGRVSHYEVFKSMEKAEVFLLLSKDERLPNVIKEAMVCGCLCITSPTPGIEELVKNGENGYVVADNIGLVAKKTLNYFQNRGAYKELIDRGTQDIREKFDVDRNINNYLMAWQDSCDKQRM